MMLPAIGEEFENRYLIEGRLGEGGFAVVFRAVDSRGQRPVAIKVLRPDAEGYDVTRASRFLREARAIAGLQDPHTLTLYDFGRSSTGLLYIVCELVAGEDLADIIATRRLSEVEVVHIMRQALCSLREAHHAGLIHRDIKPANIRVQADGFVKVLDFGLAKSVEGDERALTATGHAIGTPRYMSPEQIFGDPLTPATDIYSMGVTVVEALLGGDVLVPGRVRIGEKTHVDARLRMIVNRMVAREVADRYESVDAVLADLARWRPPVAPTVLDEPEVSRESVDDVDGDVLAQKLFIASLVIACLAAALWAHRWMTVEPEPVAPPVAQKLTVRSVEQHAEPAHEDEPLLAAEVPVCERAPLEVGLQKLTYIDGLTQGFVPIYYPPNVRLGARLPLIAYVVADRTKAAPRPALEELGESGQVILAPLRPQDDLERLIKEVTDKLCVNERRIFFVDAGGLSKLRSDAETERLEAQIRANCEELAGIATVNERLNLAACPAVPAIHLTGQDDFAFPTRDVPMPTTKRHEYRRTTVGKHRPYVPLTPRQLAHNKAHDKQVAFAKCAADRPLLGEVVDAWLEDRRCAPELLDFQGCKRWECQDAPLVVCEIPGGRVWSEKPGECDGAPPTSGNPGAKQIWSFLGLDAAE